MALQRDIRIHQYLDDWLVRATSHQTCLQHTQTLVALCRELGWLVNKKSEIDTKQVFNFVGYQFDLREGKVRPTPDRWQTLQDTVNSVRSSVPGPAVHVPHRAPSSHKKAIQLERLHMRPIQWHLKNNCRVPESLEKVVAGGKQCASRSTITPTKTCSADIYRRIKRRVGHSLK